MHEAVRRPLARERFQDAGAPLDRDVVHDQQEHCQGLHVQPPGDGPRPPRAGDGSGLVDLPAAAAHRVLVVLRHGRGGQRHVDDLPGRHDSQVSRARELQAARARALREQRHRLVRCLRPGKMCARARLRLD